MGKAVDKAVDILVENIGDNYVHTLWIRIDLVLPTVGPRIQSREAPVVRDAICVAYGRSVQSVLFR